MALFLCMFAFMIIVRHYQFLAEVSENQLQLCSGSMVPLIVEDLEAQNGFEGSRFSNFVQQYQYQYGNQIWANSRWQARLYRKDLIEPTVS